MPTKSTWFLQVFVSRGQLAKTALACVSSCMATDQWGGLLGVLQGAQAALEGQQEPELRALAADMQKVCLPWPKHNMPHNLLPQ